MANRLARESSPYLLQHANNPVDWFAWGEEAFASARDRDRPIFLSIGYSTCHWCHVMEHESFESGEVAAILNRDFVSIKVDREERPDVDRVYMTFVQATTGAGGWPMSVWLTPQLKPFYGGTYFPPTSRWGRPGFVEILGEITRTWNEERGRVESSADTLLDRLRSFSTARAEASRDVPRVATLEEGVAQFQRTFDRRYGGFGDAPKFPRPSELLFLLRESARTDRHGVREIATETLRAMAMGGMRDHLGGGFHRYSVDAQWRVPHFEKMLYDQAQLVLAYLEAAQASGEDVYRTVAEDTLTYVRRDLVDPGGAFFSAEDADSVPPEQADVADAHKVEGAFYVWGADEVESLLGEDADVVRQRYGIEPGGNAPHDPQGEFRGKNLLYVAQPIEAIAARTGHSADEVVAILGRARARLYDARLSRPRPHLDDKVLTAWNGLMIAAFARAARVTPQSDYEATASAAARFMRHTLWDPATRRLLRRYRAGHAAIDGYAEDYAYLVWGLLELFQVAGDVEWLDWALQLQARHDELFWDEVDGGWFSTTGADPSVLLRLKEDYDGAEPSASSVSVQNLLTIGHLTGDSGALARAERTLARHGERMGELARAVPFLMSALSAHHAGLGQIVIVGQRDAPDRLAMQQALASAYLPFHVTVWVEPGEQQQRLSAHLPWISAMTMRGGKATAYVCRDFTCQEPVTTVEELVAGIQVASSSRS